MEIICDNHKTHDLKWVFEDRCVACMVESLDNPELTKARKKVVLVYFLETVRLSCKDEITSLLASNTVVVSRIIQSVVDLACMGGQEVVLHPLVGEALIELVCLLENVKVEEETIITVSKKLEEVGLKGGHFSALTNLLGHLLQKFPTVLPVFLNEYGDTINLLLQGLTYLDEEVQMSCSFTWFQMLTGLSRQPPEMDQPLSPSTLTSIGIPTLQRVAFDVLFLLDTCDLSEDLELNMLGLLKALISNSLPIQNILMKVAEHGDGVQIMLVFKKLVRSRRVKVQAGATQCLLVLLRGELCPGHSELVFRADLTEYLFEALSTSSEILISSLLRCLELLSQQETFYSRHFDVYGIESLVRCMDDCNGRHFLSPLSRAYELLVVVLSRQKPNGVKLFTDSEVYEHLLDVILDSTKVSRQFQKDMNIMFGSMVETFLLLMRTDYLPQAVPFKKISEVASVLIQHAMTLSSSPPSSIVPPDSHLHRSTHIQKVCGKDVPGDLGSRSMLLVSDLILHQWRILMEVLENDLLDDDAFQSDFQTTETNPDARGDSNVFGCRHFFDHLCKFYFEESVSSLMKIGSISCDTFSTVPVDVVASNFLASILMCYQVFQHLLEKYHDLPSKITSSHSPAAFSRNVMEVSDCEFFVRMFDFKSRSSLSEETKSLVNEVLLKVLKPLLDNIGIEDEDLINVFVMISRGLHSLEGSLKEVVDEFISTVTSPSLGDDEWHGCRESRGCHPSLNHGVALLASLYLYTIDNEKHFIPRRMELVLSFIKLISHHRHPLSSSTSPLPSFPHSRPIPRTSVLKFVVHLLTLQEHKEDATGCIYEAIGDMDATTESQLSEWMEGELTTVDVWCPRPVKFLNWAYKNQLLHDFCEHFLIPRVLKTPERTDDVIAVVCRFEPCLKSIMSVFASSEDKDVLVNILDLLQTCLASSRDRQGVGGSERGSLRRHVKAMVMSAAPRMFTQFGDGISKYNKALFINLMTFLNDDVDDDDDEGDRQLVSDTVTHCDQGDSITTQDLKLVSYVESLLEVADVYAVENDDFSLQSSSLMFINSMLIKSYTVKSKQVFLLLTSAPFPDRADGKLLHFINSVNSNPFPLDGDADVREVFLSSLQTLCILMTFRATFALEIGCRLYVHESNVDLSTRPPDSIGNARSRFDNVSEMAVLSQTIKSLFWGLYFVCGSSVPAVDTALNADNVVSDVAGSGFIKILFDEKRRDEDHVREKFDIADIPIHVVRSVYCVVLNLMASENELLRICCINCMSAIIRYLDSRGNLDAATRGKLKKHLLNLYWLDYLVKNILTNISSSRLSSIPTSYLKLFDLVLHQNPEAMATPNGSSSDGLVNLKEVPRFMATWFCREDVSESSSLLLLVMNKIMDKNLLKSDKKLKEQVSEKLKNIGVQISQGTAATPQDRYTVCGVLSRLLKKLQRK